MKFRENGLLLAVGAATPLADTNKGSPPESSVPAAWDGNRPSTENASSAGRAEPEHQQAADVGDDGSATTQSSPAPRTEPTTHQHQVQEIYRLVDGVIEDLQQVLRALRTLDKD